jgi:hypothetical protein
VAATLVLESEASQFSIVTRSEDINGTQQISLTFPLEDIPRDKYFVGSSLYFAVVDVNEAIPDNDYLLPYPDKAVFYQPDLVDGNLDDEVMFLDSLARQAKTFFDVVDILEGLIFAGGVDQATLSVPLIKRATQYIFNIGTLDSQPSRQHRVKLFVERVVTAFQKDFQSDTRFNLDLSASFVAPTPEDDLSVLVYLDTSILELKLLPDDILLNSTAIFQNLRPILAEFEERLSLLDATPVNASTLTLRRRDDDTDDSKSQDLVDLEKAMKAPANAQTINRVFKTYFERKPVLAFSRNGKNNFLAATPASIVSVIQRITENAAKMTATGPENVKKVQNAVESGLKLLDKGMDILKNALSSESIEKLPFGVLYTSIPSALAATPIMDLIGQMLGSLQDVSKSIGGSPQSRRLEYVKEALEFFGSDLSLSAADEEQLKEDLKTATSHAGLIAAISQKVNIDDDIRASMENVLLDFSKYLGRKLAFRLVSSIIKEPTKIKTNIESLTKVVDAILSTDKDFSMLLLDDKAFQDGLNGKLESLKKESGITSDAINTFTIEVTKAFREFSSQGRLIKTLSKFLAAVSNRNQNQQHLEEVDGDNINAFDKVKLLVNKIAELAKSTKQDSHLEDLRKGLTRILSSATFTTNGIIKMDSSYMPVKAMLVNINDQVPDPMTSEILKNFDEIDVVEVTGTPSLNVEQAAIAATTQGSAFTPVSIAIGVSNLPDNFKQCFAGPSLGRRGNIHGDSLVRRGRASEKLGKRLTRRQECSRKFTTKLTYRTINALQSLKFAGFGKDVFPTEFNIDNIPVDGFTGYDIHPKFGDGPSSALKAVVYVFAEAMAAAGSNPETRELATNVLTSIYNDIGSDDNIHNIDESNYMTFQVEAALYTLTGRYLNKQKPLKRNLIPRNVDRANLVREFIQAYKGATNDPKVVPDVLIDFPDNFKEAFRGVEGIETEIDAMIYMTQNLARTGKSVNIKPLHNLIIWDKLQAEYDEEVTGVDNQEKAAVADFYAFLSNSLDPTIKFQTFTTSSTTVHQLAQTLTRIFKTLKAATGNPYILPKGEAKSKDDGSGLVDESSLVQGAESVSALMGSVETALIDMSNKITEYAASGDIQAEERLKFAYRDVANYVRVMYNTLGNKLNIEQSRDGAVSAIDGAQLDNLGNVMRVIKETMPDMSTIEGKESPFAPKTEYKQEILDSHGTGGPTDSSVQVDVPFFLTHGPKVSRFGLNKFRVAPKSTTGLGGREQLPSSQSSNMPRTKFGNGGGGKGSK